MLELQLKPSELSVFKKCTISSYSLSVKMQVQQFIKAIYTTYFSSFSSFIILHQLIKSFVIPTHNRVYSQLKSHFLKSDLKYLKNLNSLKNLKIDRLRIVHTDRILLVGTGFPRPLAESIFFVGTGIPHPLVQNIANGKIKESSQSVINDICSNILSKGMVKIFHMQSIQSQWFRRIKKTQNSSQLLIYVNYCNSKKVSLIPV